jgi:hypothetical protein
MVLVILGALLLLLAPPVWIGVIVLVLGIVLEATGIAIERSGRT